jgi:processive 1,2-diacylglycerol beta-glucosyltransferase
LKLHGLKADRPIVLQLAGGFGIGPIERLFAGLLEVQTPLQMVSVAGKNADAKRKLESIKVPSRHRAKILGYTDKIDELMSCADIVVSKPGGLTTSEVLARGASMVIVNPIPGQESRNSDYLLENGAAIKINNVGTMAFKIEELLRDGARLRELKRNAKRIARPQAAYDVARIAMSFFDRAAATTSARRASLPSVLRRSS